MTLKRFCNVLNVVADKTNSPHVIGFLWGNLDLLITSNVRLDYLSRAGEFFYFVLKEAGVRKEENPFATFSKLTMEYLRALKRDSIAISFCPVDQSLEWRFNIPNCAVPIEDIFDELGIRNQEDFLALLE